MNPTPNPAASPSAPQGPRLVRFTEPTEGAFTLVLPEDWAVQAGVMREGANARTWCRVVSPGGRAELRTIDPRVPMAYVDPGFGASLPPMGQPVRPYTPPLAFAEEYARFFAAELGASTFEATGSRSLDAIVSEDPRPETRRRAQQFVQRGGEGAGLAFTCPGDGVSGQVDVLTTRVPGPSGLVWTPIVTALAGPSEAWADVKAMLLQIAYTYTANPAWQQAQQRMQQMAHQSTMDTIDTYTRINGVNAASSAQHLRQDAATSACIGDQQRETFDYRMGLNDEMQRRMGNAINGTADVYDPISGTVYHGVPAGYKTYWTDALTDGVIASEGYDNPDPVRFNQATNLDDLPGPE